MEMFFALLQAQPAYVSWELKQSYKFYIVWVVEYEVTYDAKVTSKTVYQGLTAIVCGLPEGWTWEIPSSRDQFTKSLPYSCILLDGMIKGFCIW